MTVNDIGRHHQAISVGGRSFVDLQGRSLGAHGRQGNGEIIENHSIIRAAERQANGRFLVERFVDGGVRARLYG